MSVIRFIYSEAPAAHVRTALLDPDEVVFISDTTSPFPSAPAWFGELVLRGGVRFVAFADATEWHALTNAVKGPNGA